MTRTRKVAALAGLMLGAMLLLATPAYAPLIPASVFLVKNNTAEALRCSTWTPTRDWSAWHTLLPGGEITARDTGDEMHLFCSPPAEAKVWRLGKGNRYSLLRETPSSPIRVRRIEPDS